MSSSAKTRAEQHIETLLSQLPPDSPRYRALASARDFKSSWVSLGEQLQSVRRHQLYSEWGYDSFDDYCRLEIRIKRLTALKLTNAYRFLEKREPELLKEPADSGTIPDYRAVDLLRQADEEAGFGEDDYRQLRAAVIEQGRSLPTVQRQFNQVARAAEPAEATTRRSLQSALAAIRRLQNALQPLPQHAESYREPLNELARQIELELASGTDEEGEQTRQTD